MNKDEGALEELSESQRLVLHDLDSGGVIGPLDDPRPPVALSTGGEQDRLPPSWRLRQSCGGEVPDPIGDDEMVRALTRIARDVFCVLLSPADLRVNLGYGRSLPASEPLIGLSHAISAHPLSASAAELILEQGRGWTEVSVRSALSMVRGLEPPTPDSTIGAGAERWRHLPGATVEDFMRAVAECVDDLRRLEAGEPAEAPALIGLRGLQLDGDREHRLPFGVLRPPTGYERRYAPFGEDDTETEAVLETRVSLEVWSADEAEPEDRGASQLRLAGLGRSVSLASALARRDQVSLQSAVAVAWITEVTPFRGSGAFTVPPILDAWLPSVAYDADDVEALAAWVVRVEAANLSHVEIAVARLLRALLQVVEAGESLIDAVIAWDALLGSRRKSTYRVTAGLTALCEDDAALHVERRAELADIYDKRSRLVHGDIAGVDLDLRNRAIQVGLEALARLITDHPALLELPKSETRVGRLLDAFQG